MCLALCQIAITFSTEAISFHISMNNSYNFRFFCTINTVNSSPISVLSQFSQCLKILSIWFILMSKNVLFCIFLYFYNYVHIENAHWSYSLLLSHLSPTLAGFWEFLYFALFLLLFCFVLFTKCSLSYPMTFVCKICASSRSICEIMILTATLHPENSASVHSLLSFFWLLRSSHTFFSDVP